MIVDLGKQIVSQVCAGISVANPNGRTRCDDGMFLREASVNIQTCPTNVDILTVPAEGIEPPVDFSVRLKGGRTAIVRYRFAFFFSRHCFMYSDSAFLHNSQFTVGRQGFEP